MWADGSTHLSSLCKVSVEPQPEIAGATVVFLSRVRILVALGLFLFDDRLIRMDPGLETVSLVQNPMLN